MLRSSDNPDNPDNPDSPDSLDSLELFHVDMKVTANNG